MAEWRSLLGSLKMKIGERSHKFGPGNGLAASLGIDPAVTSYGINHSGSQIMYHNRDRLLYWNGYWWATAEKHGARWCDRPGLPDAEAKGILADYHGRVERFTSQG